MLKELYDDEESWTISVEMYSVFLSMKKGRAETFVKAEITRHRNYFIILKHILHMSLKHNPQVLRT